jgi:hypothetical protein
MLMAVFIADTKEFGELFTKWDTLIDNKEWEYPAGVLNRKSMFYPLPKGKVIVLLLITYKYVWTTIRRYIPYKEKYYRSLVGQDVKIKLV